MFKKGDLVLIKNFPLQYLVAYVNKGNGKIWVSSTKARKPYFWRVSPKRLTKVGYIR